MPLPVLSRPAPTFGCPIHRSFIAMGGMHNAPIRSRCVCRCGCLFLLSSVAVVCSCCHPLQLFVLAVILSAAKNPRILLAGTREYINRETARSGGKQGVPFSVVVELGQELVLPSPCAPSVRLPTVGLKAEIFAKERHHMILEAVRHGAGMRPRINFKAVRNSIVIQNLMQFVGIDA